MNELMKKRTGSKEFVNLGDVVNQTLTLTNRSSFDVTDVRIQDTFSSGITFNATSLAIDGTSHPTLNPLNGFNLLETIKAGSSATVTYRITIDADATAETFTIFSTVTYTADGQTNTETSDRYTMQIPNGEITVAKSVNKTVAISGDELEYTIVVTNIGNIRNTSVTIKDAIPDGTAFVTNSVIVNGSSQPTYNPASGFSVGNIDPNAKATASFKVTVLP